MLHVVICEDNPEHLKAIESIVTKHIETENVEMELIVSASGPDEVLAYLEKHPDKRGLYFLDVDLQHDGMDGIALGKKIREADPRAKIVFITTHDEAAILTFKLKIAAMDYIIKDRPEDVEKRVIECILVAYERYMKEQDAEPKFFRVNTGNEAASIPLDDILFFETHPLTRKRMIMHTEKGKIDFRGLISEVEKLVPDFYRCHKSILVNPNKILRVDKTAREAIMTNGQHVLVARDNVAALAKMIGQ